MHQVVNKLHRRIYPRKEDGGFTTEVFEVGSQLEPTEAELKSFPDRFVPVVEAQPDRASAKRTPDTATSGR